MVYEAAITHWRRLKHDAQARTMGVLYWQLNDVWQARLPAICLSPRLARQLCAGDNLM